MYQKYKFKEIKITNLCNMCNAYLQCSKINKQTDVHTNYYFQSKFIETKNLI